MRNGAEMLQIELSTEELWAVCCTLKSEAKCLELLSKTKVTDRLTREEYAFQAKQLRLLSNRLARRGVLGRTVNKPLT